jgi:uncharacterized membrane protein
MSEHSTTLSTNVSSSPAERQERRGSRINVGETERLFSVVGGGALLLYGLRRSLGSLALAVGGGMLIYRGVTGHCKAYESLGLNSVSREGAGVTVDEAITVNKPIAEVYRFYRNLENHPRFIKRLKSVQAIDSKHSHWVLQAPMQKTVEWDAEITEERENHMLSWHSLPGADVTNAGTARFRELPGERGTEIHISLEYHPPGGVVGTALSKIFNTMRQDLREDLRHLKQLLEAGEQPTLSDQPAGR